MSIGKWKDVLGSRRARRQDRTASGANAPTGDTDEYQGTNQLAAAEPTAAVPERADVAPEDPEAHKIRGLMAIREGRLEDAAVSFRESLRIRPDNASLRNDFGNVLARMGMQDEAEEQYRAALRLQADFADAHNNLGNILGARRQHDEAAASYREALRLRPNYAEAHNNLGMTLRAQGELDKAIGHYQHAVLLRPAYADAHRNMGMALAQRNKPDAAMMCYQQATRLKPDDYHAHFQLGNILFGLNRYAEAVVSYQAVLAIRPKELSARNCLAITLMRQDKFDEAIACFRETLRDHSNCSEAWTNMGVALERSGRADEAIDAFKTALTFRPDCHVAYANLGKSLMRCGRFDESCANYRKSLDLNPNAPDTYNNFGNALSDMGRHDEAIACFTRCLELRHDHPDARVNRGLAWLRKGDYAQGWAEYESRWTKYPMKRTPLLQPRWNGFPLNGRTILLVCEQGFGDVIQFIRYAPILKEQGARVIFECRERLMPLMADCPGVDVLIAQGAPLPQYDVYAPLLSIPGLVGTSVDRVPCKVPYLATNSGLVEKWRSRLGASGQFKVGITWQGSRQYSDDANRSIPLDSFAPLADVPGVRLYSLQKNDGAEQLSTVRDKFEINDLSGELDEETGAFMDTAAVLANLDLLISCDTAVAHLAGALGVPVWLALSARPDWRWMSNRDDSPWYPTMRLFRQRKLKDWTAVFDQMADELHKLVPSKVVANPVVIETAPGELIDKITILEIKSRLIEDREKLAHVRTELRILEAARDRTIARSEPLLALTDALKEVNTSIWAIEDEIRQCERWGDFGSRFVELARSVYKRNDERAAIKRRINVMLGSAIVEEKSYDESKQLDNASPQELRNGSVSSSRKSRLVGSTR